MIVKGPFGIVPTLFSNKLCWDWNILKMSFTKLAWQDWARLVCFCFVSLFHSPKLEFISVENHVTISWVFSSIESWVLDLDLTHGAVLDPKLNYFDLIWSELVWSNSMGAWEWLGLDRIRYGLQRYGPGLSDPRRPINRYGCIFASWEIFAMNPDQGYKLFELGLTVGLSRILIGWSQARPMGFLVWSPSNGTLDHLTHVFNLSRKAALSSHHWRETLGTPCLEKQPQWSPPKLI